MTYLRTPEHARNQSKALRERGMKNPALRATIRPTTLDIAWAAGLYEGEGCCNTRRRLHVNTVSVYLGQKDPEILHRLQKLFGGRVTVPEYQPGRALPRWTLHGVRAVGFLLTIYGLLSTRRQGQIRTALHA